MRSSGRHANYLGNKHLMIWAIVNWAKKLDRWAIKFRVRVGVSVRFRNRYFYIPIDCHQLAYRPDDCYRWDSSELESTADSTFDATKTVDYCNALLHGTSSKNLDRVHACVAELSGEGGLPRSAFCQCHRVTPKLRYTGTCLTTYQSKAGGHHGGAEVARPDNAAPYWKGGHRETCFSVRVDAHYKFMFDLMFY